MEKIKNDWGLYSILNLSCYLRTVGEIFGISLVSDMDMFIYKIKKICNQIRIYYILN